MDGETNLEYIYICMYVGVYVCVGSQTDVKEIAGEKRNQAMCNYAHSNSVAGPAMTETLCEYSGQQDSSRGTWPCPR